MKKFVALFLMLALCMAAFAGCTNEAANTEKEPEVQATEAPAAEPTEEPVAAPQVDPLENAVAYLRLMYKNAATKTPADYKVVGAFMYNDESYDIVWTVNIVEGGEADAVVIGEADENKQVTIDVNESCAAETAYTLVGTVQGKDGKTAEVSFEHVVPQGFDLATASYDELVNAAYELEEGAAMEGTFRLYGKVVKIDTPYSEEYKNITVTIAVAGMDDKPVQCYRLSGEGVETLAEGEWITVEGSIKNYKGTVEFDKGCVLVGRGEILDQSKLLEKAYALEEGAAMAAPTALKGVITKIDTPYSEEYKNITVTIVCDGIEDKAIQCYRLSGEGADKLAEGDEIAVLGTIKNYKGTIEFDKGCLLIPVESVSAAKTLSKAYALEEGAELKGVKTVTGTIIKIDTAYSEEYKNITVTIAAAGLANMPIQCYRLAGEGADKLAEGDVITVSGVIKNYKGTIEFDKGCTFVK